MRCQTRGRPARCGHASAQEVESVDPPTFRHFIERHRLGSLSAQKHHLVSDPGVGYVGQVDPHVFKMDGACDRDTPSVDQGCRSWRDAPRDAVAPAERQNADAPALPDRERPGESARILRLDPLGQDQSRLPGTHGGPQRDVPARHGRRLEAVENAPGVDGRSGPSPDAEGRRTCSPPCEPARPMRCEAASRMTVWKFSNCQSA